MTQRVSEEDEHPTVSCLCLENWVILRCSGDTEENMLFRSESSEMQGSGRGNVLRSTLQTWKLLERFLRLIPMCGFPGSPAPVPRAPWTTHEFKCEGSSRDLSSSTLRREKEMCMLIPNSARCSGHAWGTAPLLGFKASSHSHCRPLLLCRLQQGAECNHGLCSMQKRKTAE